MSPSRGGGRVAGPVPSRPLRSAALFAFGLLVVPGAAFHDDDCEVISKKAESVVDWVALRNHFVDGEVGAMREAIDRVWAEEAISRTQCRLGVATACVMLAVEAGGVYEVRPCLDGLSVQQILASRWPIFKLLANFQRRVQSSHGDCDDLVHPSLDWAGWRKLTDVFADSVPPWLNGEPGGNPDGFNDAIGEAAGIVWKGSSGAVAHGMTIAEWTNQCVGGVLSAYLIQSAGRVMSGGDVYRIVERPLTMARVAVLGPEDFLQSSWPLFGILHVLSLLKLAQQDHRFSPGDLAPLAAQSSPAPPLAEDERLSDGSRSETWQAAALALRRAAAASTWAGSSGGHAEKVPQVVLLTLMPLIRFDFLMNFFKHADRLDFAAPLAIIPGRDNLTEACETLAQVFLQNRAGRLPQDWSPCLPFVSMFAHRAQYMYIHVALQLGLAVFWFDFHVVWQKSPLSWARSALSEMLPPLSYQQDCWREACSPLVRQPEVFVAEEFYQKHWPRNSLLLLRPTSSVKIWIEMFTRWLCTYPYADVSQGLHYVTYPTEPDIIPGLSMLPVGADMPRVALGLMDTEQQFVTFDGWFGFADEVVSVEVGGFVQESDRKILFDRLLMGDPEDTRQLLMSFRKMTSPKRPTQRLYERVFAGEEYMPCQWEHVPNAYIGGFAGGVETIFTDMAEARCECLLLGAECRGVTCEGDVAAGPLQCTMRRGDPPLSESPYGEESFVKRCASGGCDAPPVERIVHVNFADGCCEADQQQSSKTAMQFGADESRPLRGDFLDEDFRRRNHHLLTFNRTPELTQHKTPSGKIGYYVWKAYVVLRTLEDPSLPWDTTAVVWTDAGIFFVNDMRPLINKYLRSSDVAATRTPMLEGDFSKRDAFILLDADYQTIMETNQIATGIVLVRKTKLAIQFLEGWLRASEDPRIMTEEPSVLGMPDYYSYKNNNDDQTAFSLLFKRYGFEAFSVGERDEVVYTGRNLAKFVKFSDDFALGAEVDRDSYLRVADDAARERR